MSLGAITLGALALAVVLSCTTRLNVGLLAIALAWIIGVHIGDMPLGDVTAGFPTDLFLTLAGVTLLFSQARVNGTLDVVAHNAIRLCRGRVGVVPMMYFALGAALATAGPGNIATAALLAPMAMATAMRMRISPFLMAIMVGNGANSGSLSPLAPTGLIVAGLMERIGLPEYELWTWLYNFAAHAVVAFGAYFIFGGAKLLARSDRVDVEPEPVERLNRHQTLTLLMIGMLVLFVVFGRVLFDEPGRFNIGMAAFGGAVLLSLLRAADDHDAIKGMPWSTILMVCGVTVLISLLEETGGMELFTGLISSVATEASVVPFIAVAIGVVSAYSSTSGVVLPVFLPTVPGLIENFGGSALALASTMNVAGHLVDVSPLSTLGALCVAAVPAGEISRRLFNQLLAWGLSMTVVGAGLCWLLFA